MRQFLKYIPFLILYLTSHLLLAQTVQQNAASLNKYSANTADAITRQIELDTRQQDLAGSLDQKKTRAGQWLEYYLTVKEKEHLQNTALLRSTNITPPISQDSAYNTLKRDFYGTFEYYYASYIQQGRVPDAFPYLDSAMKKDPDHRRLNRDLVDHYELTGNTKERNRYLLRMEQSGEITQALKDYNYNVLQSVDDTAVLFTFGQMDTYPLWLLQATTHIKPKVVVMNINLLRNRDYRQRMMAVAGLRGIPTKLGDARPEVFLAGMLSLNTQANFYFGLTVAPNLLDDFPQKLYLTGLAFRYSSENFDNLAILADNWERKFRLPQTEVIQLDPAYLPQSNSAHTFRQPLKISEKRDLNSNYLLPALSLYRYYQGHSKDELAQDLEKFIDRLTLLPQEKKVAERFMQKR